MLLIQCLEQLYVFTSCNSSVGINSALCGPNDKCGGKLKKLQKSHTNLKNNFNRHETKSKQTASDTKKSIATCTQLSKTNSDRIKKLNAQITGYDCRIKSNETKIRNCDTQTSVVAQRINKIQIMLNGYNDKFEDCENKFEDITRIVNDVKALGQEISQISNDNNSYSEQISGIVSALNKLNKEVENLDSYQYANEISAINSNLSSLLNVIRKDKSEILQNISSKHQSLSTDISSIRNNVSKNNQDIADLNASNCKSEIKKIKNSIKMLENNCHNECKCDSVSITHRIKNIENNLVDIGHSVELCHKSVEDFDKSISANKKNIKHHDTVIKKLQHDIKHIDTGIDEEMLEDMINRYCDEKVDSGVKSLITKAFDKITKKIVSIEKYKCRINKIEDELEDLRNNSNCDLDNINIKKILKELCQYKNIPLQLEKLSSQVSKNKDMIQNGNVQDCEPSSPDSDTTDCTNVTNDKDICLQTTLIKYLNKIEKKEICRDNAMLDRLENIDKSLQLKKKKTNTVKVIDKKTIAIMNGDLVVYQDIKTKFYKLISCEDVLVPNPVNIKQPIVINEIRDYQLTGDKVDTIDLQKFGIFINVIHTSEGVYIAVYNKKTNNLLNVITPKYSLVFDKNNIYEISPNTSCIAHKITSKVNKTNILWRWKSTEYTYKIQKSSTPNIVDIVKYLDNNTIQVCIDQDQRYISVDIQGDKCTIIPKFIKNRQLVACGKLLL